MAQELESDDARGGLYDGFEAYQTLTDEDRDRALAEGLVVIDANVLLNLYRYLHQPREDLFLVLEGLGDRLWLPHQALLERGRFRGARGTGLFVPVSARRATLPPERGKSGSWRRQVLSTTS